MNQVLDQLEKFVEKASQPGVLGLAGRKVEKQCARELGTYFKNLGRRVEKLHLEDLTKEPAATADQAKAVVRARLHNVLRMERASLVLVLKSNLHSAYLAGRKHSHVVEAFDPDEARDEKGMWTNSSTIRVYHGKGLGAGNSPMNPHGFYVTTDKEMAGKYFGDVHYLDVKGSELKADPEVAAEQDNPRLTGLQSLKLGSAVIGHERYGDLKPVGPKTYAGFDRKGRAIRFTIPESVKEAGQPFTQLGQTGRDAIAWAEQQAGDLVTGLDNTSIDLIADSVAQGIESQVGPAGTARLIKEAVDEMSSSRAFTIASTEMNRAFSLAAMDGFDASGIEYKQIVLSPEACPVCVDNAADDPLPVDEEYDSGDLYPPFHPNCRCAITGARAPEDEDPINV